MEATILAEGPKVFFVTPALFLLTCFSLHLMDWRDVRRNWSFRYLLQKIYQIYMLACIEKTQAKVVLTFIDNSTFAQNLSRIDHKRTYYFIQNGMRTLTCVRDTLPTPPHPAAVISMTNFFCFGQRDVDLFARNGHRIDNYFPIGSLVTGCYKSKWSSNAPPNFDLCLISQYVNANCLESSRDTSPARFKSRLGAGVKGLNLLLAQLIEETGLSLAICPCSGDEAELSYLRSTFGDRVFITKPNYYEFLSYRMCDQSRLVIGLISTLLSEAFSWGKKVLWCNVTEDEHFEMPEAGISYFHGDDYAAFKERVLMLLNMPQADYEMDTRESARYISNYDPANPPHEVIRSAVIEALAN